MTIELITGTPGAGKTCYAVASRLMKETGRKVAVENALGNTDIVERRIVVAGIRGLVVGHERLPHTLTGERILASDIDFWNACDKDGEPHHKRLPGDPECVSVELDDGFVKPVEASLFNWWLWCRPGDLIVCDEVQYIIPRGTLGKAPPHYIKTLEIHRHYGVDFIFITQNPQLIDGVIRGLVGLHRHVRSVFGSPLCMVYEWDHASNTERYQNASKSKFLRRSKYFKLYKSTVAVLKPPSSGRGVFVMLPIMFLVAGIFAWKATGTLRHNGEIPLAASSAASSVVPGAPGHAPAVPSFAPRLAGYVDVPELSGCYSYAGVCRCMDRVGRQVLIAAAMCKTSAAGFDGLVRWEPRKDQPVQASYGAAAPSEGSGHPVALASVLK